jgi:hypothetical protein
MGCSLQLPPAISHVSVWFAQVHEQMRGVTQPWVDSKNNQTQHSTTISIPFQEESVVQLMKICVAIMKPAGDKAKCFSSMSASDVQPNRT